MNLVLFVFQIVLSFRCTTVGEKCEYEQFSSIVVFKEKDDHDAYLFQDVKSGEVIFLDEVIFLELTDGISMKLENKKFLFKGERIKKGSCVPYFINEILLID